MIVNPYIISQKKNLVEILIQELSSAQIEVVKKYLQSCGSLLFFNLYPLVNLQRHQNQKTGMAFGFMLDWANTVLSSKQKQFLYFFKLPFLLSKNYGSHLLFAKFSLMLFKFWKISKDCMVSNDKQQLLQC